MNHMEHFKLHSLYINGKKTRLNMMDPINNMYYYPANIFVLEMTSANCLCFVLLEDTIGMDANTESCLYCLHSRLPKYI